MLLRRITDHVKTQNWFAVALDFVIVVFGIYVGLQVNNWNESRIDRIEEDALLTALSNDFESSAQHLAGVKQYHQLVLDAGQTIITYGETGFVPEAERARFDHLLSYHAARFIFLPVMGTVDSLLGTDRINLIRNQDLIAQLTQWPQLVASLNVTEIAAQAHYHELIFPFLASRIDFEDLDKGLSECCFNDPDTGKVGINRMVFPWDQKPTDAYLLVQDQEFLNLIYWHWVHSQNKLQDVRQIEDSLFTIQELLNEEMRN